MRARGRGLHNARPRARARGDRGRGAAARGGCPRGSLRSRAVGATGGRRRGTLGPARPRHAFLHVAVRQSSRDSPSNSLLLGRLRVTHDSEEESPPDGRRLRSAVANGMRCRARHLLRTGVDRAASPASRCCEPARSSAGGARARLQPLPRAGWSQRSAWSGCRGAPQLRRGASRSEERTGARPKACALHTDAWRTKANERKPSNSLLLGF